MDAHGFGIGAVINPDDGNSGGFFNGSIDEVSLYTTVLSQATVTTHFQLGGAPSVDASGPAGGSVDATGLVGDRLALRGVDDAEPGPGRRHRPGWRRDVGQRPAARHGDAQRRQLRDLRRLHRRRQRPHVADVRHRRRRGLLPLPVRRQRHPRQPDDVHQPRHQGRPRRGRGPVAGVLVVHQHLLARERLRRSTTGRPRPRVGAGHRGGERAVRHRRLRVPGARHRLDGDSGRDRRDDVLVERGGPRGSRDQERDRHQQRRHHLRRRAVHAHRGRRRSDRQSRSATERHDDQHHGQRHAHHAHRRRLGCWHPDPAAAVGHR